MHAARFALCVLPFCSGHSSETIVHFSDIDNRTCTVTCPKLDAGASLAQCGPVTCTGGSIDQAATASAATCTSIADQCLALAVDNNGALYVCPSCCVPVGDGAIEESISYQSGCRSISCTGDTACAPLGGHCTNAYCVAN
jgi:hypothetical protein